MAEEKKSFFARLREGLTKTRNNIVKGFDSVFSGYSVIDDEFYEELEETMIMGDLGGRATEEILDRLKEQVNDQGICDPQDCREILIDSIREQMHVGKTAYDFEKEQSVVMVIGVNGVGKTTSIGKLASKLKKQGRKVLIAAADTCRYRQDHLRSHRGQRNRQQDENNHFTHQLQQREDQTVHVIDIRRDHTLDDRGIRIQIIFIGALHEIDHHALRGLKLVRVYKAQLHHILKIQKNVF